MVDGFNAFIKSSEINWSGIDLDWESSNSDELANAIN